MTILPNYGRKELNLVCGRRWFHMVNKLNKIFITKVLPRSWMAPPLPAESRFQFHERL